jgi:hypothetical protein
MMTDKIVIITNITLIIKKTNFVQKGGQSSCTVCPPGYECPLSDQAIEQQCVTGTYSTGGQSACTYCPAGKACDLYGNAVPLKNTEMMRFLNAYFDLIFRIFLYSDTRCYMNELGVFRPLKFFLFFLCPYFISLNCSLSGNTASCAPGQYSLYGSAACTACTAGSYCPFTTLGRSLNSHWSLVISHYFRKLYQLL